MKKARDNKRDTDRNGLHPEYRLDYGKSKPNRFGGQGDSNRVVVVLDEELASVFQTPDSVRSVLRALIDTMPPRPTPVRKKHASGSQGKRNAEQEHSPDAASASLQPRR